MRAFLIKCILYAGSLCTLPQLHKLANFLAKILLKQTDSRLISVTKTNISHCLPNLSAPEQQQLAEQSIVETCKTFTELSALWLWSPTRIMTLVHKVSGEELLHNAYAQNKGVILITPHLGAWEMAGLYASQLYPITSLYRPPKLIGLQALILRGRQQLGARLVATDKTGIKALYQGLRKKNMIGILPDQVPTEAGMMVPFFGVDAYTMSLVSRLAVRTGAPVIFTFAERLPAGQGFHIHFMSASSDIYATDLHTSITALNQGVENCARQCLAQYQWSYKRFKGRDTTLYPDLYA